MSFILFQTHLMGGIDLPPDEFYHIQAISSRHPHPPRPGNTSKPLLRPHSQQSGPQKSFKRYDGPIYLPLQIFKLLSQDAMKTLKAYNTEVINRFTRGRSTTLKLWKSLGMTLLSPLYLILALLTLLKVT